MVANNFPYALVAGASKGIGYSVAEALAKRNFNLILIARRLEALAMAKQNLESLYGVHIEILSCDLSKEESAKEIASWCIDKKISLNMLCNIAGLGGAEDYLSLPPESLRYMINLNISSCVALSFMLLPLLEKNAPSYILNVASMAAYAPIPAKNLYAATKSSVLFFSYSLHYQLKKKNISVSCLTPGPVFTKPGIEKETREKLGWLGMQLAVDPKQVGEIAVRDTLNKKLVIIPGKVATIMSYIVRFLPRRFVAFIYYRLGNS